jgi:hypothetical protein
LVELSPRGTPEETHGWVFGCGWDIVKLGRNQVVYHVVLDATANIRLCI